MTPDGQCHPALDPKAAIREPAVLARRGESPVAAQFCQLLAAGASAIFVRTEARFIGTHPLRSHNYASSTAPSAIVTAACVGSITGTLSSALSRSR